MPPPQTHVELLPMWKIKEIVTVPTQGQAENQELGLNPLSRHLQK